MNISGEYLVCNRTDAGHWFERLVLNERDDAIWGWILPLERPADAPVRFSGKRVGEDRFSARLAPRRSSWRLNGLMDGQIVWDQSGQTILTGQRRNGAAGSALRFVGEHDPRLDIRASGIAGRGLHAHREIRAGEEITPIRGQMTRVQTPYSVRITDEQHCEPHGFIRYVNHACVANALIDSSNTARPVLRAKADIAPGDEISFDYIENEGQIVGGFECQCDAPEHRIS